MLPVLRLQIRQTQLVVGFGKPAIYLGGVAELNDRFTILAFIKVALSALEILLLAHIGIVRTTAE